MGFDVSGLTNYVNQQSTELIGRAYFDARSADYFTIQAGIKSAEAIQLLAISAVPQADTACSFNASGTTTLTQRNITVGAVKYQDTLCMKDLRAKWTQIMLRSGSNADSEVNEQMAQAVADQLIKLIKEHVEVLDWQGDTTSGDAYLSKYDGLLKLIDAASPIDGNTGSVSAITTGASGNSDQVVYAMCDARTAAMKGSQDCVLFVGTDFFDGLVDTLIGKNNFHIDATDFANYTMRVPGRNVEVVGVNGLVGTNRLILGIKDHFVLGVDMLNEEEEFKIWYSQDDDNVKYSIKFKRGVQVAYPSQIVEFTLA
jgi:hypothetical protein